MVKGRAGREDTKEQGKGEIRSKSMENKTTKRYRTEVYRRAEKDTETRQEEEEGYDEIRRLWTEKQIPNRKEARHKGHNRKE